jgi:hypothetical protein
LEGKAHTNMKGYLINHWASLAGTLMWLYSHLVSNWRRMDRISIGQRKGIPEWAVTIREKDREKRKDADETKFMFGLFLIVVVLLLILESQGMRPSLWALIARILLVSFLAFITAVMARAPS